MMSLKEDQALLPVSGWWEMELLRALKPAGRKGAQASRELGRAKGETVKEGHTFRGTEHKPSKDFVLGS